MTKLTIIIGVAALVAIISINSLYNNDHPLDDTQKEN